MPSQRRCSQPQKMIIQQQKIQNSYSPRLELPIVHCKQLGKYLVIWEIICSNINILFVQLWEYALRGDVYLSVLIERPIIQIVHDTYYIRFTKSANDTLYRYIILMQCIPALLLVVHFQTPDRLPTPYFPWPHEAQLL